MKLFVSSLAPLWIYAALFVRTWMANCYCSFISDAEYQKERKICGQRSSIMCHVVAFILRKMWKQKSKKPLRLPPFKATFFVKIHHFPSGYGHRAETSECVYTSEKCIWTQFLWIVKINLKNFLNSCRAVALSRFHKNALANLIKLIWITLLSLVFMFSLFILFFFKVKTCLAKIKRKKKV